MKHILFILTFFSLSASAQNIDMEKDTIQMKGVEVNKKKGRQVSYKFNRGICTHFETLSPDFERATMAYDMPAGILKKLRFEFNHASSSDETGKFKDTEIEVNFYEVNPDGNPGEKIASKIIFVPGSHSGKMDIDVSELGVRNEKGIYIALRRIKKDGAKAYDFEVDCSCRENKKYKTMSYSPARGTWLPARGSHAFELTVTIEK